MRDHEDEAEEADVEFENHVEINQFLSCRRFQHRFVVVESQFDDVGMSVGGSTLHNGQFSILRREQRYANSLKRPRNGSKLDEVTRLVA